MSPRSTVARNAALQPEYVTRERREAVFRFSVPVLRVRDVAATVAWYTKHLGFRGEHFPPQAPYEFATLERDGVQLLVRRSGSNARRRDKHSGWDLYLWVDGVDFERLESSVAVAGAVVRPMTPMGNSMAELEIRDPDGYVLCIGGPTRSSIIAGGMQ